MSMSDALRKKLSFTTNEKTERLITYKNELGSSKDKYKLYVIILIISGLYIGLFQSRYLYYLLPTMIGGFSKTSISQILKIIDMAFLLTCIISGFLFYSAIIEHKKHKSNYNLLRIDLLESSAENLCKCNNECNCKDEYIKYMLNDEGIDLIFK